MTLNDVWQLRECWITPCSDLSNWTQYQTLSAAVCLHILSSLSINLKNNHTHCKEENYAELNESFKRFPFAAPSLSSSSSSLIVYFSMSIRFQKITLLVLMLWWKEGKMYAACYRPISIIKLNIKILISHKVSDISLTDIKIICLLQRQIKVRRRRSQ